MNKKIKFSVIVPVYNVEKYVKKSLDSIYKAIDEDCEVIIIDDGSKDKSLPIVKEYVMNLKNDILKKQTKIIEIPKNMGLANTKNVGLENAKGEFISFVDSDDTINENFYIEARKYVDNYDVIIYDIYAVYDVHSEYNHIVHVIREDAKGEYSSKFIHGAMQGSSCNKIIKRNLYKNYTFPTGKEFEDVSVTPFILADAKNIKYIPNPYYLYLQRETSIVGKNKWDVAFYKICENVNNTFISLDKKDVKKYIEILNEFYLYRIIDSFDYSLKKSRKEIKKLLKEFIEKNKCVIDLIYDYFDEVDKLPENLTNNQKRFVNMLFKELHLGNYKKSLRLLKERRWFNYFRSIVGSFVVFIRVIFGGPYNV